MKPVLIDLELMEPGSRAELITSENQQSATDLPASITPTGDIASRWRLTDEERAWVAAGADIYVFSRTFGRPLQPISVVIGPERRP